MIYILIGLCSVVSVVFAYFLNKQTVKEFDANMTYLSQEIEMLRKKVLEIKKQSGNRDSRFKWND